MTDVVNLSRRSFFRGVGALGAMALTGRQVQLKAQGPTPLQAPDGVADWPEWRGRGRLGVWTESGILDRFPASGLQVVWRTPVHGGYAGPAVTGGRVFVADYAPTGGLRGVERILSLDAGTGRTLWSREWDTSYIGMLDTWAIGPAATPTVDDDRVYVLGRAGALSCLNAGTGDVVWQKDYMKDYGAEMPTWGFTGAPLVDGNRLVCLVGGAPDAKVIYGLCSYGQFRCLHATTGERVWETQVVTGEKARWASGQIVRQGNRYFINNDRGDLIIARLSPKGYEELSRTTLLKPTSNPGNRRALEAVNWSHPAYANRRIYARNDQEILCASLGGPL